MKNRSSVPAILALVAVLIAGAVPALAQGEIIYLRPGERPDFAGAVDGWTGSWAQFALEDSMSYVRGPLRDMRRSWNASAGYADPYYGSGVSPVRYAGSYGRRGSSYGSYGFGPECYSGPDCGPYIWGRRYNWNDARYTGERFRPGTRRGYHHQATQNNVNAWGAINLGATVAGTVISEVRADKRHKREMEALRSVREEQQEQSAGFADMADAIDRRYASGPRERSERPRQRGTSLVVVNSTGEEVCVNGQQLAKSGPGARTTVNDPDFEVAPPHGKSICPVEATFVGESLIQLTCR